MKFHEFVAQQQGQQPQMPPAQMSPQMPQQPQQPQVQSQPIPPRPKIFDNMGDFNMYVQKLIQGKSLQDAQIILQRAFGETQ